MPSEAEFHPLIGPEITDPGTGLANPRGLIAKRMVRYSKGLLDRKSEMEKVYILGQGQKGWKKRSARSDGVVRKWVATVEKFLPWWTPETLTEEISISV